MEIRREHKNGVILEAIKTYEELTEEEKGKLVISSAEKISDYKNFRVDRNKKDEITRVKGYDLAKERSRQLNERVDFVDALHVVYGKKGSKQQEKAKERVNTAVAKQNKDAEVDVEESPKADLDIVEEVLNSSVSSYKIEEVTGISRATLARLRNGKANLMNISFSNAIKLTNFGIKMKEGHFYEV